MSEHEEEEGPFLPVEVELYIEPDGAVTFADLAAEIVPIAQALNPDQGLACEVSLEEIGAERDGPMVARMLRAVVQAMRDRVAIWWLRWQVTRLKAADYDRLVGQVHSLRRVLGTQERIRKDLEKEIEARDRQIERLRAEYVALEQSQLVGNATTVKGERLALFRRLQSIATQLPTLRAAVEAGGQVGVRDVLDLLRPLDEALSDLGFEMIGQAGEIARYDPQRHKPVGRGARSVVAGDRVRVRYVGYMFGDEVVCKAEVVRVADRGGQRKDRVRGSHAQDSG